MASLADRSSPTAADLTLGAFSAASLAAVALGAATGGRPDGPTLCLFKSVTGLPCPFCGVTRSLFELGHGHVAASVELSPLGLLVPLVAVAVLTRLVAARRDGTARPWPSGLLTLGSLVVAVAWAIQLTRGVS
jgi:hypothetical protein